ncbi:MAG TPA: hypothetical protein VFS29_01100 [Motilibacteraceae bacterium]|nr:hypothetical protein [Motilibacteraceae bacterium]
MPEIVLTPARVVREPDVVPPPRAAEVAPTALVPAPRSPEQVVDRPAPLPTSADAPSPVVELGFADGRRQVVTPSAGDALAITEAVRRLTAKVG